MKCPYCGHFEPYKTTRSSRVKDIRGLKDNTNRRRRQCLKCGKEFCTAERIAIENGEVGSWNHYNK